MTGVAPIPILLTNRAMINKTMSLAALIVLPLAVTFSQAASPESDAVKSLAKTDELETLAALNPNYTDMKASFTIDVRSMGLIEKYNLKQAKYLAFVFSGSANDETRTCPVLSLKSVKYTVEEKEFDIFHLTAEIDAETYKKVKENGCVITSDFSTGKIKYLPRSIPLPFKISGLN